MKPPKKLHIAKGFGVYTKSDEWEHVEITPTALENLLTAEPERVPVTIEQYLKAKKVASDKSKTESTRDRARKVVANKQRACFVPCHFEGEKKGAGIRAETLRQLITFDIDSVPEGTTLKDLKKKLRALPVRLTWHTTFSHTPERPRIRVVAALSEPVDVTRFESLSRAIAEDWGLTDIVDEVSHRITQVMFYGAAPKNGQHAAGVINKTKAKAVDVEEYKDRIEVDTRRTVEAAAANHAHNAQGYKGAFNRYVTEQFGDLESYINATDAIPLDVIGSIVNWYGYDRKAGDYHDADEHVHFYNSDVEIVQGTGREQHDAASLTCFYLFGDDFNAFIKHCKSLGIRAEFQSNGSEFADFVEIDDEDAPRAPKTNRAAQLPTQSNAGLTTQNKTVTLGNKVKAKARALPDCTFENERGKLVLDWVALADSILEVFEVCRIRRSTALTFAIYDDDTETWTQNENIARATLESIVTHAINGQDAGAPTTQTRNNIASYVRTIAPLIPESNFTRSNKYIAVFNNGTYEAESRTLRPSSPNDYKEIKHPNDIKPNYKQRDVKTFKSYVLGLVGDEQTAGTVYQMIGRCFVGSYKDAQKYFMLYAKGDNGKSEFLDVLAQLVGENNTASNTLEQLTGNDSRFNRIDLLGRSLNFAGETSSARLLNAQLLKDVSGGDAIKVEEKGKQGYSARTECILIFAMNELFQLSDFTHGMARRPVIIPFAKTFTDEEKAAFIRDDIRGKLKAETPAIIAFCIDEYMKARAEGRLFKESSDMLKIKDKWLYDSNYYAQFVEERCAIAPELHSTKETLYNDFKSFAADDLGLKEPVTRKAFLRGMEELGYTIQKKRINGQGHPVHRFWGIAPADPNTTRIEDNK